MTAQDASKMFAEVAARNGTNSYVAVFFAEMSDAQSDASAALDGGEGDSVERALGQYVDLCDDQISDDDKISDDDENGGVANA
jgi:hypothetical protein